MNPYDELGVSRTATAGEIKSAYRRLAVRFHPDQGGSVERFIRIKTAYETLSDPAKRAAFDRGGARTSFWGRRSRPAPRRPSPFWVHSSDSPFTSETEGYNGHGGGTFRERF